MIVRLTEQRPGVPRFAGKLVNILHTLADVFGNLFALHIQQAVIGGLDLLDKFRQLSNT